MIENVNKNIVKDTARNVEGEESASNSDWKIKFSPFEYLIFLITHLYVNIMWFRHHFFFTSHLHLYRFEFLEKREVNYRTVFKKILFSLIIF